MIALLTPPGTRPPAVFLGSTAFEEEGMGSFKGPQRGPGADPHALLPGSEVPHLPSLPSRA